MKTDKTTHETKSNVKSRAVLADVPTDRLSLADDGSVAEAYEKVRERIEHGQLTDMKVAESAGYFLPEQSHPPTLGKRTGYRLYVVAVKFSEQQLLAQPTSEGLATPI